MATDTEALKRRTQEGEDCIRQGEIHKGIGILEESRRAYEQQGIEDEESRFMLSAIYCQLGNAYYALKDFCRACNFHKRDCELSAKGDGISKAKAMSNYSMSLSMEGNSFEAAINFARQVICESHTISPKEESQSFLCRGYYNLGVAFFQRYLANKQQPNVFDTNSFDDLDEAAKAFRTCIELNEENRDFHPSCGDLFYTLAVGNLALVYAYHGKFEEAQVQYRRRLEIARSGNDVAAQWRTLINMGDAFVQTAELEEASQHYSEALALLHEQPVEHPELKAMKAKLFFNIGSTQGMLENFHKALMFHLKHFALAHKLRDSGGMARSRVLIDALVEKMKEVPADLAALYADYKRAIEPVLHDENDVALIRTSNLRPPTARPPMNADEDMMDLLERMQSRRIEEQRSELPVADNTADTSFKSNSIRSDTSSKNPEDILDLIVCIQGRRMEEQRAHLLMPDDREVIHAPKLFASSKSTMGQETFNEDHLYDMIMSRQSDRLDDQRSELGGRPQSCSALPADLPDDMADLVIQMQAGRYECQRAHLKPPRTADSDLTAADGDVQQRANESRS
ncbi:TPR-REGION domain-containing protein [Aphelenchoides fujianensis]|nr:TPR-REGION domain-containing protein [Aphelenchoides fujianensis]